MNEYSLEAWEEINPIHRNKMYQQLLGVLSIKPMTREQLHQTCHIRLQTVCGRINELIKYGLVEVQGEGYTTSGRRCEIIGIKNASLRP